MSQDLAGVMLRGLCASALLLSAQGALGDDAHRREIEQWRAERDERLRSETGWLTLVGLHWLEPGENRFGTDPRGDVVFPEGTAPPYAGSFFVERGRVRVKAAPGAGLELRGEPVDERVLQTDAEESTDVLELGDLRFHIIARDDRRGVRVKNPDSPVRTSFTGIEYFPVDPRFRVEADFVPYPVPREVVIPSVLGGRSTARIPGYLRFELDGKTHTLLPLPSGERYWLIFKDRTAGKETYGAGRYLYADKAPNGKVIVDFNRAYNPPCVFTPYATCPLPPKGNRIAARIEAGEKMYSGAY